MEMSFVRKFDERTLTRDDIINNFMSMMNKEG